VTGTVNVISPAGRVVYINGNYTPNFPRTIPYRFTVEDGSNVFETLNADGAVDYRGNTTTDSDDQDLTLKKVRKPRVTS